MPRFKTISVAPLALAALLWLPPMLKGQTEQSLAEEAAVASSSIVMRSEVHRGEVLLRWAATDAKTWRLLNKYGVMLERLTVVRDGAVLDAPERTMLYDALKPADTEEFRRVATQYPSGAIIAQAVFGESFVVSNGGTRDVGTIIALSEELQQRYALSLYAADLCFPAALAAGWGWRDEGVKDNERYLYRVVPLAPGTEMKIAEGALFVDASRLDRFPAPLDFGARFLDGQAMLSWNYRTMEGIYVAYMPERSTDGMNFAPISEMPVTKMDNGKGDMTAYIDSIANDTKYWYRLSGVTPFGTRGEYGDTASGVGRAELQTPPFITRAVPDGDGGATIEWEFASENEQLTESFTIERSDDSKTYSDCLTPVDKRLRSATVRDISPTNYFVVAANTLTGRRVRSLAALVQPVDSLPPAVPEGLKAVVDTSGVVTLSWRGCKDKDLLGYRIYRGQTMGEELVPLNDIAHCDTVFLDRVEVRSLNSRAYYAVTSLDQRYNQSGLSEVAVALKPEVIPPTPPLIRQIKVEDGRNTLVWVSGQEENLAGYDIYRRTEGGGASPAKTERETSLAAQAGRDTDGKVSRVKSSGKGASSASSSSGGKGAPDADGGRGASKGSAGQQTTATESAGGMATDMPARDADGFALLSAVDNPGKCTYDDTEVENSRAYTYRLLSRSIGGLRSAPSPDYRVTATKKGETKASPSLTAALRGGVVKIAWKVPMAGTTNIQLYRKTGEGPYSLMRDGLATTGETEDANIAPGAKYDYMLVVRTSGSAPISTVKSVKL
ncbi:MAG: hypothetical protein LBH06_05565 [Rikenellaceae bacterium]|jgi:hypothetical protein|nr:hypothetical protein [Rikenellaceae bacterium]